MCCVDASTARLQEDVLQLKHQLAAAERAGAAQEDEQRQQQQQQLEESRQREQQLERRGEQLEEAAAQAQRSADAAFHELRTLQDESVSILCNFPLCFLLSSSLYLSQLLLFVRVTSE